MIPFNVSPVVGTEAAYVQQVLKSKRLTGDAEFVTRCREWFEARLGCAAALLVPSCTHALELAALLANVQPGDEVIMPSFTFVSTASAFVLRGATIVFVDVQPETMNIDASRVAEAVTTRTKVIVPVHYGGVACDVEALRSAAPGVMIVEDAAQAIDCTVGDTPVGSHGDMAAFSFHATKNVSCGEGGLLAIRDRGLVERAEILREKGTNRGAFFRGEVDKYTWVDLGSSWAFDEFRAAVLWAQLEASAEIAADRRRTWSRYADGLAALASAGKIDVQSVPSGHEHAGHVFFLKVTDLDERTRLLAWLKDGGVEAAFHFVPLHNSPAGKRFGRFVGEDRFTTRESDRLLRLPLWFGMPQRDVDRVIARVLGFYS